MLFCICSAVIIINGNFYSATNDACAGSLAVLYNDDENLKRSVKNTNLKCKGEEGVVGSKTADITYTSINLLFT